MIRNIQTQNISICMYYPINIYKITYNYNKILSFKKIMGKKYDNIVIIIIKIILRLVIMTYI